MRNDWLQAVRSYIPGPAGGDASPLAKAIRTFRAVLSTLRLDETNSNIVDLLNLKPAFIEINGDILLGGINQSTVRRTDGIDIQVAIRSQKLEAAFVQGQYGSLGIEERSTVSKPRTSRESCRTSHGWND